MQSKDSSLLDPLSNLQFIQVIVDLSSIATANFDLNRLADDSGYLRTHPEFIESHQVLLVNNK